ncbi:glycosyltransferase family 1 protein, partial [bacterium]|nr:glycosyltransferase family 1 protein [bacterium]
MGRKIKVLRIIARLNIGGPAIHTILLTEGLDKSRFESILVTGTAEKSEGDMFYLAEEKGVQPVIIPELSRPLNTRNDFIAFWKLFCLIKK